MQGRASSAQILIVLRRRLLLTINHLVVKITKQGNLQIWMNCGATSIASCQACLGGSRRKALEVATVPSLQR